MKNTRRQFLAGTVPGMFALGAATAWGESPTKAQQFSRFDADAKKLVAQMTLEEKIGQMTQPDHEFMKSPEEVRQYAFGSVLSGGNSDPKSGNDIKSWTDMYDGYQSQSLKTRLRIPIVYGVDAVHGHNNVIGAVVFPHNIGLGCTRNPKLVEAAARVTAEEVKATGINWAFAPCVAVPQDIRWGRIYEGFSESFDVVTSLGEAAVKGLQWNGLNNPLSVLGCAKHFAGDGGTSFGTGMLKDKGSNQRYPLDRGDLRVDEAGLHRVFLPAYVAAVRAGVGSIMPSYNSWNGEKCSGSHKLLTEILKQQMGFEGFLISDYNALDELPGDVKQQTAQSINAGMDMVMVPSKYLSFMKTLHELVTEGKVPIARIDDAVTRILRVKFAMGLMDPKRSPLADRSVQKTFGSAEHRAVARDCVRQSLVVLKNDKNVLPVKKSVATIHVAGKSADDLGIQCGGWTISWQGGPGTPTKGTTILAAIRKAVPNAKVTHSADGSGASGAAIGIAVIGEKPYAEFMGDRTELNLPAEDVAMVAKMKESGIPVIAILLSGRPLLIDEILPQIDAFIAAWLPGTEGDGIADILFGDHKPTGKLSFTWPRAASTSFHRGDPGYQTLFPFGAGM